MMVAAVMVVVVVMVSQLERSTLGWRVVGHINRGWLARWIGRRVQMGVCLDGLASP